MPSDLPPLLLQAKPDLLDGWCGPVMAGRTPERTNPCALLRPGSRKDTWVTSAYSYSLDCGAIWLDLARAECRDRVARVAWARITNSPTWTTAPDLVDEETITRHDLDPHDDRRLPDGSRWVDAAALLAVAREVHCG